MSPEQCRAARAWLAWSMDELAARANCSNSTIRDFEAHRREPHRNRLATIRQALEVAGIVFSGKPEDGMLGVFGRVRPADQPSEAPETKTPGQKRPGGTKRRTKRRQT
jgi:transcriptional regulator with XRE-family HTH domain